MRKIHILLVDDESEYCKTLKTNAYQLGLELDVEIQITDCQNWEDGLAHLDSSYFHGLILDAKCMLFREQETENFEFLAVALDELSRYEERFKRSIPFVVNTGYIGERETAVMKALVEKRQSRIFAKAHKKDDLVQYLIDQIDRAPHTKIEREFADVFDVLNRGFLGNAYRSDLFEVIAALDAKSDVKNNFNRLRKILEAIYRKLEEVGYLPSHLFHADGRPNLANVYYYLKGHTKFPKPTKNPRPITEGHHLAGFEYLKTITSVLSHDSGPYPYVVSIYTYRSAAYALFDVLLWLARYMKSRPQAT